MMGLENQGNTTDQQLISVITVCLNAAQTIERTIESVLQSGFDRSEYIVVDGGSTDGTLEIINRYRSQIDHVVSEPDYGISDAFNKGIALSSGEYHLLLNADDALLPGGLQSLARAVGPDVEAVFGGAQIYADTRLVRRFAADPRKICQKMSVPHQAALVRKRAWIELGGYKTEKPLAMDHDFVLRLLRAYPVEAFRVVDAEVVRFQVGGLSSQQEIRGFFVLRDNLVEAGVSPLRANLSLAVLIAKSRLAPFLQPLVDWQASFRRRPQPSSTRHLDLPL